MKRAVNLIVPRISGDPESKPLIALPSPFHPSPANRPLPKQMHEEKDNILAFVRLLSTRVGQKDDPPVRPSVSLFPLSPSGVRTVERPNGPSNRNGRVDD